MSQYLSLLIAVLVLAHPISVHAQRQWAVAPRPALNISGSLTEDGTSFAGPIGGTITLSGSLIVVDAMANQLLVFDREHKLAARLGGTGDGPGEFRGMAWSGQCAADSLVVWDRRAGRMSYVSPIGTQLRQSSVPFSPEVASRAISIACSANGMYAVLSMPHERRVGPGRVVRGPSTIVLVDPTGAERRFPVEITSSDLVVHGGGGVPRPLGRATTVLLGSDRVFVGTADSAYVEIYTLDGQLVGRIRTPDHRRPISAEEYEAAVEQVASQVPPNASARVKALLSAQPVPASTSPYYNLYLDTTGALWVRTSAPTESVTRFSIFDRSGRALGRLQLPRSLTVWEIGASHILGYYLDADGEPHVVSYDFTRSG